VPEEPNKGGGPVITAGQWPWKSEPAKECVTTHQPNGARPKMDGGGSTQAARPPTKKNGAE
jgi:hypothetical protein